MAERGLERVVVVQRDDVVGLQFRLADDPVARENFLRYATSVWPRLLRAVEEAARYK